MYWKGILAVYLICHFCFACGSKVDALEESFDEIDLAKDLEDEIEGEAAAIADSMLLNAREMYADPHDLEANGLPLEADMLWMLYDEPIMLYIGNDDFLYDSIVVY